MRKITHPFSIAAWKSVCIFAGLLIAAIAPGALIGIPSALADPIPATGSITLTGASAILFSPPTLVDLNKDGKQEILVGTSDGKVYALQYTSGGSHLEVKWGPHNTATDLGCASTGIHGAISAGDLDGDGAIEVVVPVGDVNVNKCGGIVALNGLTGATKWAYKTFDYMNNSTGASSPDGLSDAVVSTPALGDLDNDGKLEIIFGSFDFRVHALRYDGSGEMPGWPVFVRDTTWSSPALADIDNDGLLEIIIGVDTHAEGPPFNTPNGGGLYVFRGDGTLQPGFPQFIGQTIYSSPAVGDLDGSGTLKIVHGTGDFFNNPTDGFKVYAWNPNGSSYRTWTTTGYVRESPALGDLDNDGKPEVVVGALDSKLYALKYDGSTLWSVTPTNYSGLSALGDFGSPALATYNNADTKPDAFINIYWDSAVLSGTNGAQLSANHFPGDSRPAYVSGCTTQVNAPALGDIDGDGVLELVLGSGDNSEANCGTGRVVYWKLTGTTAPADWSNTSTVPWPMFGQNARHTRVYPKRAAFDSEVVSHTIPSVLAPGQQKQVTITLRNTGTSNWTQAGQIKLGAVDNSDPFTSTLRYDLNPAESVALNMTRTFTITLQAPISDGYYTTDWRMVEEGVQWFGRTVSVRVKVGNQPALHVLTTQGLYAGGLATTPFPAPNFPVTFNNWPAALVWKLTADRRGYYLLDSTGAVWAGGAAKPLFPPGTGSDPRDLVLGPDGISYYELLGDGTIKGCDPNGCSRTFSPATPTGIQARSLAVISSDKIHVDGIYVVDGLGNLYRGGTAPALNPTPAGIPLGNDLIRRIKLTPNGTGYYLIDMYGNLYNGGSAPVLTPGYTPQTGQDWARDFELKLDGAGYYLLAKTDAIYSGGSATPLTVDLPPTSTNDMGRDLELVDTRVYSGPMLQTNPTSVDTFYRIGSGINPTFTLTIANVGGSGTINWSATNPTTVTLSSPSGAVSTSANITGTVNASGYVTGTYPIGNIVISGADGVNPVAGSPQNIPVTLRVGSPVFLPLIIK
jgi:Ig-like domain-containing protein/VCBS repeat protein